MNERINLFKVAPEAMNLLLTFEEYIASSFKSRMTLDRKLIELIKVRISQINQCVFCIDMHTKDAKNNGETEQRLYALSAWREAPFFTEKEKIALSWAEINTNLPEGGISDAQFSEIKEYYSDEQIVDLTLVTTAINTWNRLGIAFRPKTGDYKAGDLEL